MKTDIAVSVDIETDGPVMGVNSLRSIGAVAYRGTEEIGEFSVNIQQHGELDEDTMEFWAKWPDAWQALHQNTEFPTGAMLDFRMWLADLNGTFRFVAWPCWFDYSWVRQYFLKYTGHDPFERRFFELGQAFYFIGIQPPKIKNPTPHVALADAREQGEQYLYLIDQLKLYETQSRNVS